MYHGRYAFLRSRKDDRMAGMGRTHGGPSHQEKPVLRACVVGKSSLSFDGGLIIPPIPRSILNVPMCQQFSVWQKWAFIEQITDYQIGLKKDQESISLPIAEAEGLISERKAGSTAQKKVSGGICSEFRIDMGTGTRRSAYAIEEWIRKVQGCFKAYRRCARRFIPQGLQAPAL